MSLTKPYVSRYVRKQNYQTLNFPYADSLTKSPHQNNVSSSQLDHSAQKRSIQQKQIQDLQQKVDIILQHNDKLAAENAQLKRQLASALQAIEVVNMQKERMSRYQVQDNDYSSRKIRSDLQIKARQYDALACQLQSSKIAYSKQIEGLKVIIANLTASIDQLKLQNIKLTQQSFKIKEQFQMDKSMSIKQAQRKIQEDLSRVIKQKGEELIRQKNNTNKKIEELCSKFQAEKQEWQQRKNVLITKLQQNHNKQINELRDQMMNQFNEQLHKLQDEATQRCKNQREKAEIFIKQTLDGINNNNQNETSSLKEQINALQISLQNRKLIIKSLTSQELDVNHQNHELKEILELKRRLKEQVQFLMRENEVLKIHTAQKYERDLKEMVRIYDDKIDILSAQISQLRMQNQRLRKNYEAQLQNKIKQRRTWEIEAGQLKNLVKKLKAELKGIQQEFKLNIDGIRDQNATFSMTMMKSMIQDKDKATFFEDQNRKLRALYEKHQKQVQVQKKQAIEKVKFYESKLQHLKKLIQAQKNQLQKKQQFLQDKWNERQTAIKQSLKKQRIMMQEAIDQALADKQKIERDLFDASQKCHNYQLEIKQKKQDLSLLQSRIKQNQGHIQRLRMELQIVGTQQRQKQASKLWKQHYEEIILKLETDKEELKKMIDSQNEKIQRLVYKYKLLQEELRKATESIKKYGALDMKVIQLGMDENIVKNMSQIFAKVYV